MSNPSSKVLLINPPVADEKVWVREGRCQQWDIWGAPFPPFSLAMISTQLIKRGIETQIIDSGPEHKNLEIVLQEAVLFNPAVVILTTTSPTIESDLNWFVPELKKKIPNCKVIVVGIHVSALPKESLERYAAVDFVVMGEPEITCANLVSQLLSEKPVSQIAGIGYRNNGMIQLNPEAGFVPEIDCLGFPDWNKINFQNYPMPILNRPFSMISFSRGCPFTCKYCATHAYNGKVLRKRSVESLIDEIKFNLSLGVRDFLFWTELMTGDNKYLESFLDAVLKQGLGKKIRWVCNSRVDLISDKLAKKMYDAGCWQIAFGFEFGDDRILQLARKGGKASIELGRQAAEVTAKAGIAVDGHFILGYPGETEETLQKTIDFACSLPLTFAHFYACVPFPGAPLFEESVKQGWFDARSWEKLTQDQASMKTEFLNAEIVDSFIKKAYRSFYVNPLVAFRIMRIARNPKEFFEIFKLGLKFYHLLHK